MLVRIFKTQPYNLSSVYGSRPGRQHRFVTDHRSQVTGSVIAPAPVPVPWQGRSLCQERRPPAAVGAPGCTLGQQEPTEPCKHFCLPEASLGRGTAQNRAQPAAQECLEFELEKSVRLTRGTPFSTRTRRLCAKTV